MEYTGRLALGHPNVRLTEFTGVVEFRVVAPPEIVTAVGMSARPSSGPPVTPSSSPALVQVPEVSPPLRVPASDLVRVVAVDLDRHPEAAVDPAW